MSTLTFDAIEVRDRLRHAVAAPKHRACYGQKKPTAGLWLVHDEGVYLMSNGDPWESRSVKSPNGKCMIERAIVAYAEGLDPEKEDRMEVWDRARDAVGGDDFSEYLDAAAFGDYEKFRKGEKVKIIITETQFRLLVPVDA